MTVMPTCFQLMPTTTMENGTGPIVPPGIMVLHAGNTIPAGWLPCNGQEVSSDTYTRLFESIGTKFGKCTEGMFKVPDQKSLLASKAKTFIDSEDLTLIIKT